MNKNEVFAALVARGADEAVVEFSGGNDEGGVDNITLNKDGESIAELQEDYGKYNPETGKYDVTPGTDGELAKALSEPVYGKYYTFAGDFSVNGTVTWNVADKTVKMNASESVETYEDVEEDFYEDDEP